MLLDEVENIIYEVSICWEDIPEKFRFISRGMGKMDKPVEWTESKTEAIEVAEFILGNGRNIFYEAYPEVIDKDSAYWDDQPEPDDEESQKKWWLGKVRIVQTIERTTYEKNEIEFERGAKYGERILYY